jgi:hypothetical protein
VRLRILLLKTLRHKTLLLANKPHNKEIAHDG